MGPGLMPLTVIPSPASSSARGPRQAEQRGFGGGVGGAPGERYMAHDRRHVQDAAVAGALHPGNERAAHQESGDQARVQNAAKLFEREVDQVLADVDSRIVDQDLGSAEALIHRFSQCGDFLFICDVGGENDGGSILAVDGIAHLFQALGVAGHERDGSAGFGESLGHGLAEPAASAGDHGGSAGQIDVQDAPPVDGAPKGMSPSLLVEAVVAAIISSRCRRAASGSR